MRYIFHQSSTISSLILRSGAYIDMNKRTFIKIINFLFIFFRLSSDFNSVHFKVFRLSS